MGGERAARPWLEKLGRRDLFERRTHTAHDSLSHSLDVSFLIVPFYHRLKAQLVALKASGTSLAIARRAKSPAQPKRVLLLADSP